MKRAAAFYLLICALLIGAWQCFAQVPMTGAGLAIPAGGSSPTMDPANTAAAITLSNGNLTGTTTATQASGAMSRSTTSHSSGKFYIELTISEAHGAGSQGLGILNASQSTANNNFLGETANSYGSFSDGTTWTNNATTATGWPTFSANGVVFEMAIDLDNKTIWFRPMNGTGASCASSCVWNNLGAANPATNTGGKSISTVTGAIFVGMEQDTLNDVQTINLGGSAFADTPPTGFSHW